MTYKEALKIGEKIGGSKSEGQVLLAMLCRTCAFIHAINPVLVCEGAIKKGIDPKTLENLPTVILWAWAT